MPVTRFLALFVLVSTFSHTAVQAAPETYRVVGVNRGDFLKMRERPDADAPSIGQIPPNARKLRGFGCTDDTPSGQAWCRVKYGNTVGWVRHTFLRYD